MFFMSFVVQQIFANKNLVLSFNKDSVSGQVTPVKTPSSTTADVKASTPPSFPNKPQSPPPSSPSVITAVDPPSSPPLPLKPSPISTDVKTRLPTPNQPLPVWMQKWVEQISPTHLDSIVRQTKTPIHPFQLIPDARWLEMARHSALQSLSPKEIALKFGHYVMWHLLWVTHKTEQPPPKSPPSSPCQHEVTVKKLQAELAEKDRALQHAQKDALDAKSVYGHNVGVLADMTAKSQALQQKIETIQTQLEVREGLHANEKRQLQESQQESDAKYQSLLEATERTKQEQAQDAKKRQATEERLEHMSGHNVDHLSEDQLDALAKQAMTAFGLLTAAKTKRALLKEHQEKLDEKDKNCGICLDARANVALMPCGHCYCATCAPKFKGKKCPSCKLNVTNVKQLFGV
jgi:hypothetical protein